MMYLLEKRDRTDYCKLATVQWFSKVLVPLMVCESITAVVSYVHSDQSNLWRIH